MSRRHVAAGEMIKPGTSKYVQDVELPLDYAGALPEHYELIDLPPCKLMVFRVRPMRTTISWRRSVLCGRQ